MPMRAQNSNVWNFFIDLHMGFAAEIAGKPDQGPRLKTAADLQTLNVMYLRFPIQPQGSTYEYEPHLRSCLTEQHCC